MRSLSILLLLTTPLLAADPADAKLAATAKGVFAKLRSHTLANGLQVYLLPIPTSPVVTTMMAYRVGACDEDKDQTGLSHYLEHLLFKGTDKLVPGDVDRLTQRNGGANNAYTSEDMTNYHFDFAADRWKIALEIEADRMRNTRIDTKHEFEQEKGAVVSELKGGEDGPWDLEYKTMLKQLFPPAHPYSHPVIGEESHVRGATSEIITRYYNTWYHPNNASFIVVGGFDPDDALKSIENLLGPIPKAELPPRKPIGEMKPRTTPVRKEFQSKFDVPRVQIAFNTVRMGDPDDYVLEVIDSILGNGKTARLYQKLVEGERIATAIETSNNAGRLPGYFDIKVEMLPGKDRKKVEAIVFAELKKLAEQPIGADELARVRRSILASFVFGSESVHGLADQIARAVTIAKLDHLTTYLDNVLAVTPADVQRVAAKLLKPESAAIVWSLPTEKNAVHTPRSSHAIARRPNIVARQLSRQHDIGNGMKLTNAKSVVLDNGLKLLLLENRGLPIVVARASLSDVRLLEPANQSGILTLGSAMMTEGTTKHSGEEISTLIENAGGSLGVTLGGGSMKVLTPDTDLGLSLLFECLLQPTFPAELLESKREQLLAEIDDEQSQPRTKASEAFDKLVYGTHPFARPGNGEKAIVQKLTRDELKAFHRLVMHPNRTTLAIVGDFDSNEMTEKIRKLTADWKKAELPKPTPPVPPKRERPEQKIITDQSSSQTYVFLGHLGIKRNNPDYYKLQVMDNVLGTGPGFTDRLSSSLRDRQGLAYTVRATIADSAGEEPGTFTGYIGTFPDKFTWVRDSFLKEIERIRTEPPTAQEVDDAKQYLLGRVAFRLTSNSQVASELLIADRYNLGLDVFTQYRAAIAAVTPTDVQSVAKQYLRPEQMVIVACGPIDAEGKPLPMKSEQKGAEK